MKLKIFLITIITLFLSYYFYSKNDTAGFYNFPCCKQLEINGKQFKSRTATTHEQISTGLMFVEKLPENQGLLFDFHQPSFVGFWMKNTLIPLDIIYINSNFEIVQIYKNTIPLSEKILPSNQAIRYVFEINAGLCDKYDIKIGQKIQIKD